MNRLNKILPPFAPDYSGVCSVLYGLGGMTVIHGPEGCTGNYTGYDEPRWFGADVETVGSGLREIDAILGNEERLISQIKEAAKRSKPAFICITGTPIPMMTGTDFKGIAAEVEYETGIPSFGISTTGFAYYDAGASAAMLAYTKKFGKIQTQKENTIGILGVNAIDFSHREMLYDLKRECEKRGFSVTASLCMDASPEQIREICSVSVNLVVSGSGLQTAQYLYEKFEIPYVTGIPIGKTASDLVFETVKRSAFDHVCRNVILQPQAAGGRILILGERVMANSIRNCLIADHGISGIQVCSIFTPHPEWMLPGDVHADGEKEIAEAMREKNGALVIGDPLFHRLIPGMQEDTFLDFPIQAVSSKVYRDGQWNLIGERAELFAQEIERKMRRKG
ncbi:oxidoreductase [bacterium 1XD42-54]|nr:oxidoreductase [bacterium 1XD42-54]